MVSDEQIADAIEATAREIEDWASSPANSGPYRDMAYHSNIHIASALRTLAGKLRHD